MLVYQRVIQKLVGGLVRLDYDFPFSWEWHHPNRRTHIFQRGRSTTNQWIGLGENLQESPIFNGKIYGFRLRFSRENQSIEPGNCVVSC
jgi:hypothetical protein